MKIFPWSFAVCPNAQHPATHIGHVWSILHSRFLYDTVRGWNDSEDGGEIDLRWNLAFDYHSEPNCESGFIDLLTWMGMQPDAIHHTRDWLALSRGRLADSWCRGFPARLCYLSRRQDPVDYPDRPTLYKLLYFNSTNVYWHMRGVEHAGSALEMIEDITAKYLNLLRLPLVFYHPILRDEAGAKIDSANLNPAYVITPEIRAKPPLAVVHGLLRAMGQKIIIGGRKGKQPGWLPVAEDTLLRQVAQFYVHEVELPRCAAPGADLRVPENWRDYIE